MADICWFLLYDFDSCLFVECFPNFYHLKRHNEDNLNWIQFDFGRAHLFFQIPSFLTIKHKHSPWRTMSMTLRVLWKREKCKIKKTSLKERKMHLHEVIQTSIFSVWNCLCSCWWESIVFHYKLHKLQRSFEKYSLLETENKNRKLSKIVQIH